MPGYGDAHLASEQLRAIEERFRTVWEAAGDAMALSDPEGIVLEANPAYLELYGYSAEEIVGKNFAVIFPPELREWANDVYRQTFADPVIAPSVDATIRRKDGSFRVVDSRYTFVTSGGERTAMISIVRDITSRVMIEERLSESEERFHRALNNSPIVVFNQDLELRYTWIHNPNPALTPESVLGKTDADLLPVDEAETLTQIKRQVIESGESTRQEVVATLDGEQMCYDLTVEPIRTAGGEIVGVSCAAIDVTERKRAEEERVRLLEREQRAHAEARQAVLMRDQVLSTVAHDLRNPLTAIKGYAQLLRTRVQRETQSKQRASADVAALTRLPEQRDARTDSVGAGELQQLRQLLTGLSHIDDTVNRMNGLINDLIDMAMLQGGQPLDLQLAATDLVTLTRDAVEAGKQTTDRHTVEFHARAGEVVGEWDRPRLRRVIDNVLGNAVKYSPRGGVVTVTVGREDDGSQGDWAVLEVADSGIGIPVGDLPHIFEWFYRGNNSPEDVTGSGIGLAGAHDIVEQHGGTIDVASEVGVGTRFTIRLPL